jgi:spore germination protein (amino acid permease)
MEKIDKHQLFCLVIMGQIGSTNLWALGIEAKQDAWIVILISMLLGLGLIWSYIELSNKYPGDHIAGITVNILGRVVGWPLAFTYFLFLAFNATRNVSEFGDLINMTFLQETPPNAIKLLFLFTIIYILFQGVETFARITEIILPVTVFLIFFIYIMAIISGPFDIKNLSPVFGNGMKPILKNIFPVGLNFPFGSCFLYMQYWRYADSRDYVKRTSFIGVIISGLLLTLTTIVMITTIGPTLAADFAIPFLEIIKLINIGDIITNFDAIGVILIFLGGFYLAALNFYSAALIISYLFKIKNTKWVLIPLGLLILWYSNVYEPNYPFHVRYLVPQFWQQQVPFYDIIPILLLLIYILKDRCNKLKNNTK